MKIENYQRAKLIVDQIDEHLKDLNRLYEIRDETDHYRGERITVGTTGSPKQIQFENTFVDTICDVIQSKIETLKRQLDKL
jgi:hypothetical protein